MANETLGADIYDIYSFTKEIQNNFTEAPEDTLMLSTFGYLAYNFSKILQNSIIMASEYANEAIPTKAKFARNVIAHSLALGINDINATPAHVQVLMAFPKDQVEANLVDNKFVYDKDIAIYIGEYEFHTDYDIIITKNLIGYEGTYVYSAKYDPGQMATNPNPISNITSEYLPSVGETYIPGAGNMLLIPGVLIRQVTDEKTYKKVMTDNPVENKTLTFEFENQLAGFNVEVEESNETYILTPVYDGLYDYKSKLYCNYTYLNTNTIRVKFNSDSREPKINANITIHAKTTKGAAGNFTFNDDIMIDLKSERISYDNCYVIIKPSSTSVINGEDSKSISDLKKIIPKEALSRGTITTSTDLENFFNSLNTDYVKLYFKKRIHNHITHSFYAYLLMKNSNNQIIPTNTLDKVICEFSDDEMSDKNDIDNNVFIIPAGSIVRYDGTTAYLSKNDDGSEEVGIFKYIIPFSVIISSNPLLAKYVLDIIDISKYALFDFVNQNSAIQFICSTISWKREFVNNRNKYILNFSTIQNLNRDLGLVPINNKQIVFNEDTGIVEYDGDKLLRVFLVLYNSEDVPFLYIEGNIVSNGSTLEYTENTNAMSLILGVQIEIPTDSLFNSEFKIHVINDEDNPTIKIPSTGNIMLDDKYVDENMKAKIFIYGKSPVVVNNNPVWRGQSNWDGSYGRQTSTDSDLKAADKVIPGMDGYTLYNIYEINEGLDFLYSYSHLINSSVDASDSVRDEKHYTTISINKMPLLGYNYIMGPDDDIDKESRVSEFISELELRRAYIDYCLLILEGGMGIDLKFFNTYGPSKSYYVNNGTLIDRTNLSLEFDLKLRSNNDKIILDSVIDDIKAYIEDINEIKSLHMPNLITEITNKYRNNIEYFEFIKFNEYGPEYQHIYTKDNDKDLDLRIPEFLCVDTDNRYNVPKITINLK